MNILISAFDHVPGANPASAAIHGMLRALGGAIDAVTLKAPGEPHVQRMGTGKLLRVPVRGTPEEMRAAFARALLRQFEVEYYDVVHVRSAYEAMVFSALPEPRQFKLVYEVSSFPPHDAEPQAAEAWRKAHDQAVAEADVIIVPTEATGRDLKGTSADTKIRVIPPGVNVDEFDWLEAERDTSLRLLFLGHFNPDRDLDTLLSATKEVLAERQVELLIAGEPDPTQRALMRTLVEQHQLRDVVHVRGAPLARAMPRLITACDIALVPATATERFQRYGDLPQPLLEYMACKRPIIGAGVPGIAEVLRDEREGLLYSPSDPHSLADAIRTLASNRKLSRQLAQAAYDRARDEFSSSRRRRALRSLYHELIPGLLPEDLWEQAFDGPATSATELPPCPSENTILSDFEAPPQALDLTPDGNDYCLGPEWFIEAETTTAHTDSDDWSDATSSGARPTYMDVTPSPDLPEGPQ